MNFTVETVGGPVSLTAEGDEAFLEFCRFAFEELKDPYVFLWPPKEFVNRYPKHIERLRPILKPEAFAKYSTSSL
jgi:hypothetical protein